MGENKPKLYIGDCTDFKQFNQSGGKRYQELLDSDEPKLVGLMRGVVTGTSEKVDRFGNDNYTVKGTMQLQCENQEVLNSSQFSAGGDALGMIVEMWADKKEKKEKGDLRFELKIMVKKSKESPTGYSYDYRVKLSVKQNNLFESNNFLTAIEDKTEDTEAIDVDTETGEVIDAKKVTKKSPVKKAPVKPEDDK